PREYLLAVVESSLGDLDTARRHLEVAREIAEQSDDARTLLKCQLHSFELVSEYGSAVQRDEAIAEVEQILQRTQAGAARVDELAALTYQLGAALIRTGRRSEAADALERGFKTCSSEYWRMRMANALSASAYYLGRFEEALDWLTKSWQIAEGAAQDSFKARILHNRGGVLYALGRLRQAIDEDALSAKWARRTGNPNEYSWACAGMSIDLTLLGRYEEAIERAREAQRTAELLGDPGEVAKAMELQALAYYHIGDSEISESLARNGLELLAGGGIVGVRPRLEWLMARISADRGDFARSEELLEHAESVLLETRDWEDLPGVQIELSRIRARGDSFEKSLQDIRRLALSDGRPGPLLVQLYASLAIGEILVNHKIDDIEDRAFLQDALGRSEDAGIVEVGWRLSYYIGELTARRGGSRSVQARFRHALHSIRQVADGLRPQNRKRFLARADVKIVLDRVAH
ncbi:MAG TPA: tetratricopeptide repeat protein, partial [Thermoleophilia bacterium]|nr:tetratricopeptide repeat protein [Thermoleophilia bacterium]